MDYATCATLLLATHFASSLLPLTGCLIPVVAQIGRLVVQFLRADPTPQACHQFETQLHDQLRELGRIIVEWTFTHIEPHDPRDMPNQMCFQGVWYRRRSKTPNRSVATLFGTITLWRYPAARGQTSRSGSQPLAQPLGVTAARGQTDSSRSGSSRSGSDRFRSFCGKTSKSV